MLALVEPPNNLARNYFPRYGWIQLDGVKDRAFPSELSFHPLGKADFIPFLWWLLVSCQGEMATGKSRVLSR